MRFLIYVCVEKTDTVCTFFQRTHCKLRSTDISFIAIRIFLHPELIMLEYLYESTSIRQ